MAAGAYPGFIIKDEANEDILPPGWDARPSQGCLATVCHLYPFRDLGGERQHGANFLSQGNNGMTRPGLESHT